MLSAISFHCTVKSRSRESSIGAAFGRAPACGQPGPFLVLSFYSTRSSSLPKQRQDPDILKSLAGLVFTPSSISVFQSCLQTHTPARGLRRQEQYLGRAPPAGARWALLPPSLSCPRSPGRLSYTVMETGSAWGPRLAPPFLSPQEQPSCWRLQKAHV